MLTNLNSEPQNHMFAEMRAALGGIPRSRDILEHVYSLPTPQEREAGMEAIRAVERRNMVAQVAQPGLQELMAHLDARGVRKAICTRNFETPVAHLLSKFLAGSVFAPVVTRDFRPPKPDPAGILFIARSWGLVRKLDGDGDGVGKEGEKQKEKTEELVQAAHQGSEEETRGALGTAEEEEEEEAEEVVKEVGDASELIMVGDSVDDMTAGRRAGAATVLLVNDANRELADHEHTDLVIERLDDLIDVLEKGFVGRKISTTTGSG